MAGYQFIHYEAYARTGNKNKRDLVSIAKEADRAYGNHPHVPDPLPPEYLLGNSFTDTARQIISAANASQAMHSGKPRKLRKDVNVGIGLIASYPLSLKDLNTLSEHERDNSLCEIREWAYDVLTFAGAEFPGQIQCAALHWDEPYPHLHVMIGSTEPTDNFQAIHKGEQARKRVQGNDRSAKGKKAGNDAYVKEMRRFQDAFHEEVSLYYGQARLGPKRRRLTRSAWKMEQAQAEALANSNRRAVQVESKIETDLAEAAKQAQIIVDVSLEEMQFQAEKIEQERRQAESHRLEVEALESRAKHEYQLALNLKQKTEQIKALIDERMHNLSRYDGLVGRVLGWVGIRQRIERKATEKLERKISGLRSKVEKLRARVNLDKAMKQQHDDAIGALKSIQIALSASAENYPVLGEKEAFKVHFDSIQKILGMNLPAESLKRELDDYMIQLRVNHLVIDESWIDGNHNCEM